MYLAGPRPRGSRCRPSADQNVLLITIDTLRADALSSYGGPAQTPNLDRLAAQGARFTFAHAHAVVTLPSHTSILSGLLPYEHGMRDNSGFRVRAGTPTLATRLKARGFATGAFVGGFPLTKRFGLTPGFDVYDDQMPETRGAIEMSMPERPADVVVSRATAWVGAADRAVLRLGPRVRSALAVPPPQDLAAQLQRAAVSRRSRVRRSRARRRCSIGCATLPRPTLVIVTADHGESLGEHGELTHGMFAYEPTLRVPLIVARIDPRASARRPASSSTRRFATSISCPTVLDARRRGARSRRCPGSSLREASSPARRPAIGRPTSSR